MSEFKVYVAFHRLPTTLREGLGGKLLVECTGEGVMFIEANAVVSLEQFGHAIHPHFCVTRLRCGGFIFVLRFNHIMSDALGKVQFMNAIGEMAQGNLIINPLHELACCLFFFGSTQVPAIRKKIPHHLGKYSTFEVLNVFLWRCRTIALSPDPEDQVRLIFMNNVRAILNPPLPKGYYGNAYAISLAVTTAGELCENPLEYAL
nr:benzyl alcohol o-benzoyltransferase [Quercus suber]